MGRGGVPGRCTEAGEIVPGAWAAVDTGGLLRDPGARETPSHGPFHRGRLPNWMLLLRLFPCHRPHVEAVTKGPPLMRVALRRMWGCSAVSCFQKPWEAAPTMFQGL